jgi:alpha-galactosidase
LASQVSPAAHDIGLNDGRLALTIDVAEDQSATMVLHRAGIEDPGPWPRLPVVDIMVAGAGRSWSGSRYTESVVGHRLQYRSHQEQADGQWRQLALDRYPSLTVENCASGGLRADYAMLSRAQLQSTSDQRDYLRYPPIAVTAAAALTPEQAAVWAYPQPFFTQDEIGFTMCNALLGRIHLSGRVDLLAPPQRDTVSEAVRIYKAIRADLPLALPFWPLGLPQWTGSRLALGLRAPEATYLVAWRRPADPTRPDDDSAAFTVPVRYLQGAAAIPEVLYPGSSDAEVSWDPVGGELAVSLPRAPSACLIRVATR